MQHTDATAICRSISEDEIRSALLRQLVGARVGDAMICEEFRIERGASRVDVAVIGNRLLGYEIKSDLDSFKRFSNQIHAYNRVFDEIYLVCGLSHTALAKEIIPSWWGISVAKLCDNGQVVIEFEREATSNPKQDSFSLASLLWKDEALTVLSLELCDVPKRASSHELWESVANMIPLEKIKNTVIQSIINRSGHNNPAVNTM